MRLAPPEICPRENRPCKVCLIKYRPAEVRPAELLPAEVRFPYFTILLSPLVPYVYSPPNDLEVFFVCHSSERGLPMP